MTMVAAADFARAANLDDLYKLLGQLSIENGWAKPTPSLWPRPKPGFVPAHWSYEPAKAALDAAGRFVNTELAERRNLILVNPIPGNTYPTVRTLVAAYQMVKAGETAKSHRHTANALRVVLDTAPGTYTIVDGRKIPMEPGDVLLTPNWCWHAHANQSAADAYWMDILDVPTVHLLNPMFFEHHEAGLEPVTGTDADAAQRFSFTSIVERLAAADECSAGCREIELSAEAGRPAMATIRLIVTCLEAGASLTVPAMTSSSVMAVIAGEGSSAFAGIDGAADQFDWCRGDAVACPAGYGLRLQARTQSYVLRATDEPVLQALGWLRPVQRV